MDYKVTFSAPALADLESIVRFVAQYDAHAATRLGNSLVDEAESLARLPERGSRVRPRPGIRKLCKRLI